MLIGNTASRNTIKMGQLGELRKIVLPIRVQYLKQKFHKKMGQ
jgi:hypothetical protein